MPKNKPNTFLVDYIRLTIPFPYHKHSIFHSNKAVEIKVVRLERTLDYWLTDILNSFEYDISNAEVLAESFDFGRFHYNRNFCVDEINFFFNVVTNKEYLERVKYDRSLTIEQNAKMGICVDIPGVACRRLENHLKKSGMTLFDLFRRLINRYNGIKITRIDLNYDFRVYRAGVSPLAFYRQCEQNYVMSNTHNWDYHVSGDFTNGSHGATTTVGARESDFYLRVYDKAKERHFMHGDAVDPNMFWIRWEIELKHGLAFEAVIKSLSINQDMYGFYLTYLDILNSRIRVEPSKKQRLKGNYHQLKTKSRNYKYYANWWWDFITPTDRNKIVVTKPIDYKKGLDKVKLHGTGAFFEKLAIHISHGGDPLILLAHWIVQGKLKRNDNNFKALIRQFSEFGYDASIVDGLYTKKQAMKIILDPNSYDTQPVRSGYEFQIESYYESISKGGL